MATRWTIRHSLMLLWFKDLKNVTEERFRSLRMQHGSRLREISFIAELAERSPIIIENGSSNPSSRKNLDLRPYDRPYKVLLLTCVVNCTAGTPTPRLCPVVQWSVHWAPSRTALETCGKKNASSAFRFG